MTKFDSSRAWREASAAVTANREVLLALAGVFFMLPWLAFLLLMPEPALRDGMAAAEMLASLREWMTKAGPYLLGLTLIQACGSLGVLTLCSDRSRPTVGEAIRRAALGVLPYVGAMVLFMAGFSLAAALLGTVSGMGAGKGGTALMVVLLYLVLIYATVRLVMVAPVIAIERVYQPVRVLIRSWRLTRGNFWRIALFLLLLVIAGQVVMGVIGMLVGSLGALVAGPAAGRIAESVASAGLMGVFLVYFASVLAAMHDQLAGFGPGAAGDIFR